MATGADVITRARFYLQDERAALYRYPDTKLQALLAAAYTQMKAARPDRFLGRLVDDPSEPAGASSSMDHLSAASREELAIRVAVLALQANDDVQGNGARAATLAQLIGG